VIAFTAFKALESFLSWAILCNVSVHVAPMAWDLGQWLEIDNNRFNILRMKGEI